MEIPITTEADRRDFVAILRKCAAADGGIHVDDVTDRWRDFEAEANTIAPERRGTVYVGLWRGANDDDPEADATDLFHPGKTWLTFERGRDPVRSAKFRKLVLTEVHRRWPDVQPVPVFPGGDLPNIEDLRQTPTGYKIAASSAALYGLPASSPLVTRQ